MPGRVFVEICTINGISVYAGMGSPNGVLSATRGSVFSDKATGTLYTNTDGATTWVAVGGGGGDGLRAQLLWDTTQAADPDNGRYATWATVHAAAVALVAQNLQVDINVDMGGPPGPGVAAQISPLAAYDMYQIRLVGVAYLENGFGVGQQSVEIVDGVTFTNFLLGTDNLFFVCLSDTPVFVVDATDTVLIMHTGKYSTWRSSGTAPLVQAIGNDGFLSIQVDDATVLGDVEGVDPAVLDAQGTTTIQLNLFTGSSLNSGAVSGAAGAFLNISPVSACNVNPTQAGFDGTIATFSVAPSLFYVPGTPADWDGSPTELQGAVDRIATAVQGILVGPIP